MLRKKLLMPSVDANVLNVLESEDDDERGKYVIEYNAPLAAMDREAKKELGKGSSTTVLVDKTPRRTKSDSLAASDNAFLNPHVDLSAEQQYLLRMTIDDHFQTSRCFRISRFPWLYTCCYCVGQDIKVRVCINGNY